MADTRVRPTYGNFRRPQSAGLFGLGRLGMVVMAASLFALIIVVATRGLLWGLVVLAIALLALGGIAYKKDGRNVYERVGARVTGGTAQMAGTNLYRSGPLGRGQWGTYQLPGIAAPTRLYEYEDSYGRRFVLVYTPRAKTFTIVIESSPDGASRVDESQVDAWVADWGQWLANLGDEPGLAAASVTIETAPDTGRRLRREVELNLDPSAPEVAKRVLRTATDSAPVGASTVRAFIAIVFEASPRPGAKARTPDEMGRELGNRLPTYTASLEATGAGSAQPMSAQELCEVVRIAYDPAAALLIDEAYAEGVVPDLAWSDVGPTDHEAGRRVYQHDNAWSVTWAMTEPPRGNVQSHVLARMLRPHKDIARKRVTLIYRPYDSARAAALVEADIRASNFITTSKARPSYRLVREQRIANLTAQEEANGAGLVNFAMLVTATSTSRENREAASAAVSFLSATAKLRLRVMGSMQDSAFAAALPLGLILPRHMATPEAIRDNL